MQITYQKRDGSIIQKFRKTMLPYQIGDETGMGWKVLNIEYEYNNKYYPKYQYESLMQKRLQRLYQKKHFKEVCIKYFKSLLYNIIMLLILYYIKIRIGI